MFPLRLSLFALLLLAVLGLNNAEADDWEETLGPIGSYDTDDNVWSLTISGNYAYLADGYNGLVIVNIEDPSNPTFVGSYDTDGYPYDVTISGNYAYVAHYSGLLAILNIEDPANPTLSGSYDIDDDAENVTISGNYAYVASKSEGLIILNIEDPTNPTLAGSYDTDGSASGVTISGNYAYLADGYNGLVIVNIEDPSNPTFVGSYDPDTNDEDDLGYANDVTISGDYAYVADGRNGLVILNIEDPTNLTWVGSYDPYTDHNEDEEVGYAHDVTISGDYAYVADGSDGLVILDIEDPANPTGVGGYDADGSTQSVTISGNYAYVADFNYGLMMLDIEDPANPTLVGSYDTDGYARSVTISGNYAYVADGNSGLVILGFGYTPLAVIDSISPSPARFDEDISFSGSGEDYDGIIVAYEWTSSIDGFLGDEADFSATGFSVGTHTIYFRVQDNSSRWSILHDFVLVVNPNESPITTIDSINPSPAEEGTTVFFNGTGLDSDGTIVVYLWESSIDGFLSNEEDFTTAYLSIGNHIIYFQGQDNDGDWSDSTSESLWIYAVPVAIAGQDSTGTPGVPLQFSGAATDEDGTVVLYEWDFDGDGIFEWSSTENGRELNIYNNEGTYTATLRVTDNDGFTGTDTVEITISEKKIQIDDDGNVIVEDSGEDEEGIPSISLITSLISIGLIAIFRRK